MQYFLLGVLVLVLTLVAIRLFNQANPATMARHMRIAGAVAALAGALFFMVRGALVYAFPLAALGWWLLGGQGIGNWGNIGSPRRASGQTSRVVTEHLEMELDHASGAMRGRVLKGFFAGRNIEDLRPVELAHLWQDCRYTDPASAQLVEAFLDRIHPTWREDMARAEHERPKGPDGRMTVEEALDILGLEPGADESAIRQAHRELMLKLHPDRGGSTYLAAKINEAKDTLLGGSA
ncbi:DnaJ domain-containing protein [Hyphomicrobium sp. CS1BSMeth3]|uniref:DnaJ domain-containing protein n=1 Tax=Hyphomicrobium sp. CS1BSMeth3 TaxID=1892844 RepID=UPI0009315D51|nr:DnaJ domain-containing protein [Hyphomicrobium sp. CS1BSMeth3]